MEEREALALAERIREYWIRQGYYGIKTWVVAETMRMGAAVYGVWSNVGRGGYPPKDLR